MSNTYSYSQIQTWNSCQRKWFYNYHEGKVPKREFPTGGGDDPFACGTYTHDFLDIYYRYVAQEGHRAATEFVKEEIRNQATQVEWLDSFSRATVIVMRYLNEYVALVDQDEHFISSEVYINVPLTTPKGREVRFEGYIDVLSVRDGRLVAWDHKTQKSGGFMSQRQVDTHPQLPTYLALLRVAGYDIKDYTYNFFNTHAYVEPPPLEKLFCRRSSTVTEAELRNHLRDLKQAIDEIEDSTSYRRVNRGECHKCSYQEPCFMSRSGTDESTILNLKFDQKSVQSREVSGLRIVVDE